MVGLPSIKSSCMIEVPPCTSKKYCSAHQARALTIRFRLSQLITLIGISWQVTSTCKVSIIIAQVRALAMEEGLIIICSMGANTHTEESHLITRARIGESLLRRPMILLKSCSRCSQSILVMKGAPQIQLSRSKMAQFLTIIQWIQAVIITLVWRSSIQQLMKYFNCGPSTRLIPTQLTQEASLWLRLKKHLRRVAKNIKEINSRAVAWGPIICSYFPRIIKRAIIRSHIIWVLASLAPPQFK